MVNFPAQQLVSKAKFSKMADVSRAMVTKLCKTKFVNSIIDDKIDLGNEIVIEYLKSKEKAKTKVKKKVVKKALIEKKEVAVINGEDEEPHEVIPAEITSEELFASHETIPEETFSRLSRKEKLEEVKNLTLSELTKRYGSDQQFHEYVKAEKNIFDIFLKNLKIEETEGKLISRDFVQVHVIGLIEGFIKRLLNDTPKTLARKIFSHIKAGGTVETVEIEILNYLSAQTQSVKSRAVKALKDA